MNLEPLKAANRPCPEYPDCADDEGPCLACANHGRLAALIAISEAARELGRHFIEQPPFGDHKDGDPYPAGPAYLGPQEPLDALYAAFGEAELVR